LHKIKHEEKEKVKKKGIGHSDDEREKKREKRKREFSKFRLRNATRTDKRTENMPIQVQWRRKHEGSERMTRRAHLEEPSSTYTFSFLTRKVILL